MDALWIAAAIPLLALGVVIALLDAADRKRREEWEAHWVRRTAEKVVDPHCDCCAVEINAEPEMPMTRCERHQLAMAAFMGDPLLGFNFTPDGNKNR